MYNPPLTLNSTILGLCVKISSLLGYLEGIQSPEPALNLRKQNRIRTVQGTLAIEGNTLSLDQVTALIDGDRIIGTEKEITEVKNAISAYDKLDRWKIANYKSMLGAHKILMKGLIENPGMWRSGNVGIIKGKKVSHVAPQAQRVPALMRDLFDYLKRGRDEKLIKACVFHYEFLFIHPFLDGNGLIARLWQQLILINYNPIFRHVPLESLIKDAQSEYYKALEKSDRAGESTVFVEFMLTLILKGLENLVDSIVPRKFKYNERIFQAKSAFKRKRFSRKDYLNLNTNISTATASRDLHKAVEEGILEKSGDKALAMYKFI